MTTLLDDVNKLATDAAAALHAASADGGAALTGSVDALRDRYVGALAVQAALRASAAPSPTTGPQLSATIDMLDSVRSALLMVGGSALGEAAAQARSSAVRRLELLAAVAH